MMHVMHQPLPVLKAMPLKELFFYAGMAAQVMGKTFD